MVETVRKETNIPFTFKDAMELYDDAKSSHDKKCTISSATNGIWHNLMVTVCDDSEFRLYITLGMYKDKKWLQLYKISYSSGNFMHYKASQYDEGMKYIFDTTTGELSDLFDL